MTFKGTRNIRQNKYYFKQLRKLMVMGVMILLIFGAFSYRDGSLFALTAKPTVYIVDADYVANTSSGEQMRQYLQDQGYSVTIFDATSTLPAHATANGYDAIIFSTGNLPRASITNAEVTWAYDRLTLAGNNQRLILEGDNVVDAINSNGWANATTLRNGLLRASAINTITRASTSLTYLSNAHYVVTGITGTNPTYAASNNLRAYTPSSGSAIYRYDSTTTPNTVLSAWEDASRNTRLVVMGFLWWDSGVSKGVTNATWRQTLLKQSVDWVGEFVEVSLTSLAPLGVNPGTTYVPLTKLILQNNVGGDNTTITGFSLQQTGTATLDSNISSVKLFDDADNNGVIDNPANPLAATTFSGGSATFSDLNLSVNSTGKSYIITGDVAVGAEEDKTIKVSLIGNSIVNLEGSLIKTVGSLESNALTINNITPPSIPVGVYTANLQTGTSLRVGWTANSDTDLVGYYVYRDTSANGSFNTMVGTVAKPGTFLDNIGLTEFTTYYYKVVAYDTAGNLSDKNSSVAVQAMPNSAPVTPGGLVVSNPGTGSTLNLTWDPVTGEANDPNNGNTADLRGYNLYVATNSGGPYGKVNVTPINGNTYNHKNLTNDTTYYYKIAAVDRYAEESLLSEYQSGIPTDTTPPQIVNLSPADGQNHVSRNIVIKVEFDEPLDPTSINSSTIQVRDSMNILIGGTVSYDGINKEIRFTLNNQLPPSGTFTATLSGSIKNLSGLAFGADRVWSFGTLISPHSNFSSNTSLCSNCHSLHNAEGPKLLKAPKPLDMCLLCHDGTGSSYDVKSGTYFNGEQAKPLLSGGYDLAMGATSTHFTDLANNVYGGSLTPMTVDCNSCHNPHGSTNYRNLRTEINGVAVAVYGVVYGPSYSVGTESGEEVATYISGINNFCGACHTEYLNYNSLSTMDNVNHWRHRMGVGMTGGSDGGEFVTSYPQPGLYTSLPTEGAPTGANITSYDALPGGTLTANTYNYVVTGKNAVGESVYGKIIQVTTSAPNQKIQIFWKKIANAYKYRIYRYDGPLDISTANANDFNFLAEVGDAPTSFTDTGGYTPDAGVHPPVTSNASINCLSCHFSHGTTAVASGPTRLRRMDYYGVCQDCHKK